MMKFDDKKFLSRIIKEHRKRMNLTQAELAEKVELSDQHISRIESGCYIPSLKSFFMLADVLKIDLSEFGFNIKKSQNPIRNNLIEQVANATDTELIFYEKIMTSVKESLKELRKNFYNLSD